MMGSTRKKVVEVEARFARAASRGKGFEEGDVVERF